MRIPFIAHLSSGVRWGLAVLLLIGVAGTATVGRWLPEVEKLAGTVSSTSPHHDAEPDGDMHDAHETDGHDATKKRRKPTGRGRRAPAQ